jgi:hypothetical protein
MDPALDEATHLLLTVDGAPVEVVIAPVTDVVETLRVAHLLGGGRDDDLDDDSRAIAQTLLLHQDVVVLGAWRLLPDGSRGEWLAGIAAIRTDLGLFWLSTGAVADGVADVEPAFGDYLARRARAMRTWVVVTEDQRRMHPTVGLVFAEQPVTLPEPLLGRSRMRVPALGADVDLPYFGILRVAVVPPAG